MCQQVFLFCVCVARGFELRAQDFELAKQVLEPHLQAPENGGNLSNYFPCCS
jgi:hypothetical protein